MFSFIRKPFQKETNEASALTKELQAASAQDGNLNLEDFMKRHGFRVVENYYDFKGPVYQILRPFLDGNNTLEIRYLGKFTNTDGNGQYGRYYENGFFSDAHDSVVPLLFAKEPTSAGGKRRRRRMTKSRKMRRRSARRTRRASK